MTEPNLPRKCGQRSAHDPHTYNRIMLGKRDISFGQTFDCPGSTARKLTANEKRALSAIGLGRDSWYIFAGETAERSPQGAHMTAASLVRKGMVTRHTSIAGVYYATTRAGRDSLRNT